MWDQFITIMITVLLEIYKLIGQNFGWAIIIFTVLVRLVTYPLTAKQMKSSKAMQDLQSSKDWNDMQAKYKNDKEGLAQKQMEIYKEKGISPLWLLSSLVGPVPGHHWSLSGDHPVPGSDPDPAGESVETH